MLMSRARLQAKRARHEKNKKNKEPVASLRHRTHTDSATLTSGGRRVAQHEETTATGLETLEAHRRWRNQLDALPPAHGGLNPRR